MVLTKMIMGSGDKNVFNCMTVTSLSMSSKEHHLSMKFLGLETYPQTSKVLVFGSIDGSLATCCRTVNTSRRGKKLHGVKTRKCDYEGKLFNLQFSYCCIFAITLYLGLSHLAPSIVNSDFVSSLLCTSYLK